MNVFERIEAQQKGHEDTDIWMVGEQLKGICRAEPRSAELIEADLEQEGMGLKEAAAKIKAYADEQHKKKHGSCICVPPAVAERILRAFYGLPGGTDAAAPAAVPATVAQPDVLDLASFF